MMNVLIVILVFIGMMVLVNQSVQMDTSLMLKTINVPNVKNLVKLVLMLMNVSLVQLIFIYIINNVLKNVQMDIGQIKVFVKNAMIHAKLAKLEMMILVLLVKIIDSSMKVTVSPLVHKECTEIKKIENVNHVTKIVKNANKSAINLMITVKLSVLNVTNHYILITKMTVNLSVD